MPPSAQSARPRLTKQSSSSSEQSGNRNIRDFFRPFTIPKNRIPVNDVVEEEIVVAGPPRGPAAVLSIRGGSTSPLSSPSKSQSSAARRPSSRVSTPTGRTSPVERDAALQLDGACDEDGLYHESPPASQRRVATAVEIPTPTTRRLPQPAPASTFAPANNTSFTSMSSFTTVPLSSQASSSRRIVKDGVPLVTNSDSGSNEDSDDDLEDIVIPRKKMRMTPPPTEVDETSNATAEIPSTVRPAARHSGRISGRKSEASSQSRTPRGRRRLSRSPPRAAASTSSLLKLVREKEKREKEEAMIREAEAAFELEQRLREEKMQRGRERDLGGGLKALVADDSDEGERMMLAVERTEAMGGQEEEWFFFKGLRDDLDVRESRVSDITAFAPWGEPKFARLKAIVADAGQRELACNSGFLAECAGAYGLPPEVLDWMFQRLAREESEDVCEAYVEVFRRYLLRQERRDRALEDWGHLSHVYRTTDPASDHAEAGVARERNSSTLSGQPPGLRHVVRVIQHSCSNAGDDVPDKSFLELALASIDTHIARDADLKVQLQDSMAAIIGSVAPAAVHSIAHTLSIQTSALSLPLRCRLITALPTHTKRTHKFRRLMALYLTAHKPVPGPGTGEPLLDPKSTLWSSLLLTRLRSGREWHIAESTNYEHLNALIPILDIALDAGFPVPAAVTSTKQPPPPPHPADGEKAFNKAIDDLTDTLRALTARIRDAGTSHLRRTEGKSALERVVVRLEHSVRTKLRPRRGIFGGGGEQRGLLFGGMVEVRVPEERKMRGSEAPGRLEGDRVSVVLPEQLSDKGGDSEDEARGGAEEEDEESIF